ncbi:MAG: 3'-5' exonuclease [Eggerthellales bacterium]|nr:3'-5' exonuclease [Eggerthellales bacterium]
MATRTKLKVVKNYVALDLETTGLSAEKNRIIEVALHRVSDGVVKKSYQTLVNPGRKISAEVSGLTGITDEMVKDAPCIEDIIEGVAAFIGKSPIVGHNVSFDAEFLDRWVPGGLSNTLIDTMRISRLVNPGLENHRLGTVYRHCLSLGMKPVADGSAHRAGYDAMMTLACYEFMKDRLQEALAKGSATSAGSDSRSSAAATGTTRRSLKLYTYDGSPFKKDKPGQEYRFTVSLAKPVKLKSKYTSGTWSYSGGRTEDSAPVYHGPTCIGFLAGLSQAEVSSILSNPQDTFHLNATLKGFSKDLNGCPVFSNLSIERKRQNETISYAVGKGLGMLFNKLKR